MTEGKSKGILFLSDQGGDQYDIRNLFEEQGFAVHFRDSAKRAMQYLSVSEVALVICDWQLREMSGVIFCRQLRMAPEHQTQPLVLVGEEVEGGENCVSALEAGADDFIEAPFIPAVLLARAGRLLGKTDDVAGTMSVHVEAGQLPGILQYLETDNRTGTLTIDAEEATAVLYFREGRLVNAITECCEDLDVVSEVLCWESSDVTFHEGSLAEQNVVFDHEVTGTLMSCVVNVDEYRETQKNLPPMEALFKIGPATTVELNDNETKILEMAVNGYAIDDLVHQEGMTVRQATMQLHSLLERGLLVAEEGPFAEYQARIYEEYRSHRLLEENLKRIRDILTDLSFPLPPQPESLPLSRQDWLAPAPRLVITGDNAEHLQVLMQSFRLLSARVSGELPRTRRGRNGDDRMRLSFGNDLPFDIQIIPGVLDANGIGSLPEYLFDACSVVFVVSKQDHDSCRDNLRTLRLLRQNFRGVYYLVVPQVANSAGMYEFRMDCSHCGYRLAVDMSLSGSMGECPICNNTITIPDPLEHLTYTLKIPSAVPAVMIKPDIERHVRDLLLFVIQSIQKGCNPPRKRPARKKGANKHAVPTTKLQLPEDLKSSQVLAVSEVKSRTGTGFDVHAVESHDSQDPESAPEEPEVPVQSPTEKKEAREAKTEVDRGTKKLHIKQMPGADGRVEDVQKVLDEIMADENSSTKFLDDDSQFDIDDFVRQISMRSKNP